MLTALLRAFRAEVVRTRRTAGLLVSLAGLAICLVQALGWWAVATQELRGWSQLLAWQTAYVTGMAAPLVALIGGLAVRREQAARSGGTPWRAIGRGPVQVARIAVLAGQVLIFNLSIIVPMSFVGLAAGLGEPPLMRLLGLALVTWLGTLPILVLSVALSERIGLYLTLGLSLVWQVVGTMQAEATTWWLQPWTWAVRPSLPILQIRANGTASAPDDAVRDFSVGQPLLLAVAFAVVLLFVVALLPEPREHSRRLFRRRCRGAGRSVEPRPGTRAETSQRRRRVGTVPPWSEPRGQVCDTPPFPGPFRCCWQR